MSREEEEKWVVIDGYPNYQISNKGRIMRNGVIRDFPTDRNKYQVIRLRNRNDSKHYLVHRLVMMAFEPIVGFSEVNHKNGKKWDNRYPENLEWSTRAKNMAHAFATGLMDNFLAAKGGASRKGITLSVIAKQNMRNAHNKNGNHPNYKLTDEQILEMKKARFLYDATLADLALRYNTSEVNISLICTGKRRAKVAPQYTIRAREKRVQDGYDIYRRAPLGQAAQVTQKNMINLFAKIMKSTKSQRLLGWWCKQ